MDDRNQKKTDNDGQDIGSVKDSREFERKLLDVSEKDSQAKQYDKGLQPDQRT